MPPPPPTWRRAFNRVERLIGEPLEQAVQTRRFADVVVVTFRVQGELWGLMERGSRTVLHLGNLPTRSDVQRLSRQLTALQTEVRVLSARLSDEPERPKRSR